MISIIMSVYNEQENHLKLAIDSILNQTYKDYEFIIVLDNPQNLELAKILEQYEMGDERIVLLKNETNIGLSNSLNRAIKMAKNQLIARMDADDIAFPDRLEKQYIEINKGFDLVFTKFEFIDEDSNFLKKSQNMPTNSKTIYKIFKRKNIISHPTVMMKKNVVLDAGGYSDLRVVEDYELWYRLLKLGYSFGAVNDILLSYRIRRSSMTTSNYYLSQQAVEFIKKYYRNWDFKSIPTAEAFEEYYERKKHREHHFNQAAQRYYTLIQSWSGNKSEYIQLLRLVTKYPVLLSIILPTLYSNKKRSNL